MSGEAGYLSPPPQVLHITLIAGWQGALSRRLVGEGGTPRSRHDRIRGVSRSGCHSVYITTLYVLIYVTVRGPSSRVQANLNFIYFKIGMESLGENFRKEIGLKVCRE